MKEGLFINSNVVHEIRDANEGARLYCWNGLPNVTEYINFTYVSRIVDQAQSIPFIKLIPKGEENVSLLRRIERVGHIYLSQRDYYQLQILSEFYQCLNHLLNILINMNKSINISLIQELNNVLNTYKVIIIKGATE